MVLQLLSFGGFCSSLSLQLFLLSGYVKASPNEALIISGLKSKPRTLTGKAGIKIPFFERRDRITLALIAVDVKTSTAVPTADYININVDANVNVQVGKEDDYLDKATKNFLNKDPQYIAGIAREVLEGNMREIVGRMRLEEMVSDRQKFAELVKENAEPDLAAMGLRIISFNVQNFVDGNDVIENLGIDNIVKIKKAAAIARAESERDIKVAQAAADKESNDAAVEAQTEIAKKQNELNIKKSELQAEADTKRAIADAAYEIQKEEQRKTIEITRAAADIAKQEKEADIKRAEAIVREKALDAEIRKTADAEKYRQERVAEAERIQKQQAADAENYAIQRQAEALRTKAAADKFAKEQEAEGIAAVGKAEAEAIQAKGIAEAEAMEKKAEAYAKYNNAAVLEMIIKQLPSVAHEVAAPIVNIDKITIIDSGKGESGVDTVGGYTPALLQRTIETIKETTGVDLTDIMRAGTYDAKVNKNITFNNGKAVAEVASSFCNGCDGKNGDCQCVPQGNDTDVMNAPM